MAEKVIHQNGKSRLHRNTMTDYVLIVICALIAFVTVYPMWYVICCALSEPMRCHDCASPERICSGLAILMEKMHSIPVTEVLLIGESLGY